MAFRALRFDRTFATPCLGILAVGLFSLGAEARAPACKARCGEILYIGTHGSGDGHGIFAARLDPRTGRLSSLGLAAQVDRPTWLAVNPRVPVLYAVSEVGNDGTAEASVHSFKIAPTTGALEPLDTVGSGGGGATHLAVDGALQTVFVANYGAGNISALPLRADGGLEAVSSTQADYGTGPTNRQRSPHPHGLAVDPSHRYVLAADLGADRVFVYRIDQAAKTLAPAPHPFEALPPGSGPRHIIFLPDGKFAFLNAELTAQVRSFAWDAKAGRLRPLQTLSTTAPNYGGDRSAAEIVASRDSRFLYVSNRGEDSLVAYAIHRRTGMLREIQRLPAGGKSPIGVAIDPSNRWMIVANEGANALSVFKVDPASGKLTATSETLPAPAPVHITFYPQ
jgi:6-phosphogluconolactonase